MLNHQMVVSYKGFKSIQSQISELTGDLMNIGCCESVVSFVCSRFSIDREYYSDWLCSGDLKDLAELIVLYLEDLRDAITAEIKSISTVN